METLVIFSANVDSIDSWDLENLKYLRKLSKGTLASCGGDPSAFETLSYKSGCSGSGGSANNSADNDPEDNELVKECDELLDRALSFSRRRNVFREMDAPTKNNNGRKPVQFGGNFKLRKSKDPTRGSLGYNINTARENRYKKDIMFPQNSNGSKYETSTDSLIHLPSLTTKMGTRERTLHGRTPIGRISVPPAVVPLGTTKTGVVAEGPGLSSMVLDNCYLMDVLMVRNDSVMRNDKGVSASLKVSQETVGKKTLREKEIEMFRGSAASPSSLCSDDSFTSAIAKGFFDMENSSSCSERSSSSIQKLFGGPSCELHSVKDQIQIQESQNSLGNRKLFQECPYCGSCGGVKKTKLIRGSRGIDFRRDSIDLINDASLVPLVGEDLAASRTPPMPMEIVMPKTPSPYYIRIRKDQLPSSSSTTSYTHRNTPSNFSLDKQGQLVIDYSSNWDCLESYVKRLAIGR